MYYALGSSYFVRRIPNSERAGGVTVRLQEKAAEVGKISVVATYWKSGAPITAEQQRWYSAFIEAAVDGANEAAASLDLLAKFDIELSEFLIHDVDSFSGTFRQTAKSACRSALEAWNHRAFI